MSRVVRAWSATLHPEAECAEDGCKWTHPVSPYTRDAVKQHVKATGHEVVVEAITRDLYQRREVTR